MKYKSTCLAIDEPFNSSNQDSSSFYVLINVNHIVPYAAALMINSSAA